MKKVMDLEVFEDEQGTRFLVDKKIGLKKAAPHSFRMMAATEVVSANGTLLKHRWVTMYPKEKSK